MAVKISNGSDNGDSKDSSLNSSGLLSSEQSTLTQSKVNDGNRNGPFVALSTNPDSVPKSTGSGSEAAAGNSQVNGLGASDVSNFEESGGHDDSSYLAASFGSSTVVSNEESHEPNRTMRLRSETVANGSVTGNAEIAASTNSTEASPNSGSINSSETKSNRDNSVLTDTSLESSSASPHGVQQFPSAQLSVSVPKQALLNSPAMEPKLTASGSVSQKSGSKRKQDPRKASVANSGSKSSGSLFSNIFSSSYQKIVDDFEKLLGMNGEKKQGILLTNYNCALQTDPGLLEQGEIRLGF